LIAVVTEVVEEGGQMVAHRGSKEAMIAELAEQRS